MSELNDPRVFFAAERTLLAWNRTSLTLMAFGFVIERFGLFLQLLLPQHGESAVRGISFWVGIAFVLLGAYSAVAATVQYRKVIKTLKPIEIIDGYNVNSGVIINLLAAFLGITLTVYLFLFNRINPTCLRSPVQNTRVYWARLIANRSLHARHLRMNTQ